MPSEIDKINDELSNYCKNESIIADEGVFNIAVKLGRYLEKSNQADVRLHYFTKADEKRDIDEQIQRINDQLNAVARFIVSKAIAEQIEAGGDWEIGYGSYYSSYGKLNDDIAAKYCIQLDSVDQPERHGDFHVRFRLTGKHEECFKSRGYLPQILAFVQNHCGDDSERITDASDIDSTLYHIGIEVYYKRDEKSRNELADLLQAFGKDYLFELLK